MNNIDRRSFLQELLKSAATVFIGGSGLIFKGCSKGKDFDILIAGGTVSLRRTAHQTAAGESAEKEFRWHGGAISH